MVCRAPAAPLPCRQALGEALAARRDARPLGLRVEARAATPGRSGHRASGVAPAPSRASGG